MTERTYMDRRVRVRRCCRRLICAALLGAIAAAAGCSSDSDGNHPAVVESNPRISLSVASMFNGKTDVRSHYAAASGKGAVTLPLGTQFLGFGRERERRAIYWDEQPMVGLVKQLVSLRGPGGNVPLAVKMTYHGSHNDFDLTTPPLVDGKHTIVIATSFKDPVDGKVLPIVGQQTMIFYPQSLPRVRSIGLVTSDKADVTVTSPAQLSISFTETLGYGATKHVNANTAFFDVAAGRTITIDRSSGSTTFGLPKGFDLNKKVRITVPVTLDPKTGLKLDGKFTGKAGSGPFVKELVPAKHIGRADAWIATP